MLHPDNLGTLVSSSLDEGADVGDDSVPLVSFGHNSSLDIDHHQGGVWTI